ncbi:MAG: DUF86 domain-containing protein [Methanoregula sp.]|nr:DUF86 domain-containing protein [Methanoregula sp.]
MSEKRNVHLFLDDMDNAIHRILHFTQGMTYEEFLHDLKTQDAILRNIQVLGDAATNIPPEICLLYQDIDWKYIIGMRNLIHTGILMWICGFSGLQSLRIFHDLNAN